MITQHIARYSTIINAPIEKVWDAITNPGIIKQYFFDTDLITSWEVGTEIYFQGEWEGKKYLDKGIVLKFLPLKRLEYTYLSSWSQKEDLPENYLWVCYEVKQTDNGTELIASQSNYSEENAIKSEQDWKFIIDEMRKLIEI
mgnify:CR=1 FL=1|jgi:uncharacterized protein YndB with AHSA1/START domain